MVSSAECDHRIPETTVPELALGLSVRRDVEVLALEGGLRGRQASDGDAERGAGYVIETGADAEGDRGRLAAVLAANPNREVRLRSTAALRSQLNELADAGPVEHAEGIFVQDP